MAAPKRRRGQVQGGVTCLVVCRRRSAEQKKSCEQERNGAARRRNENDRCPCGSYQIERRQTGTPSEAMYDRGRGQRAQRGTDHGSALRQTRQSDSGEVGSEQCTDGRAHRHADTADDLSDEEEAESAPLDVRGFHCRRVMSGELGARSWEPVIPSAAKEVNPTPNTNISPHAAFRPPRCTRGDSSSQLPAISAAECSRSTARDS